MIAPPQTREAAHRALLKQIAHEVNNDRAVPCIGDTAPAWIGDGTPAQQRAKAALCLDCPALRTCHDYVATHGERSGTWAGTIQSERDTKGKIKQ